MVINPRQNIHQDKKKAIEQANELHEWLLDAIEKDNPYFLHAVVDDGNAGGKGMGLSANPYPALMHSFLESLQARMEIKDEE